MLEARDWRLGIGLLGIALVIVGYFGPWIPHETSALTVTGFELAEFAKFFPQVQGGVVPVVRSLFLTPITAAAILLGLAVSRMTARPAIRLGGIGLAVLLALVALPPYGFYLAAEYRGHLILAVGGAALILLTLLSFRLSRRAWGILLAATALAGILPALHQFTLLRPLVAALYGAPLGLGWGLVACLAGFALLLLSGILAAVRQ